MKRLYKQTPNTVLSYDNQEVPVLRYEIEMKNEMLAPLEAALLKIHRQQQIEDGDRVENSKKVNLKKNKEIGLPKIPSFFEKPAFQDKIQDAFGDMLLKQLEEMEKMILAKRFQESFQDQEAKEYFHNQCIPLMSEINTFNTEKGGDYMYRMQMKIASVGGYENFKANLRRELLANQEFYRYCKWNFDYLKHRLEAYRIEFRNTGDNLEDYILPPSRRGKTTYPPLKQDPKSELDDIVELYSVFDTSGIPEEFRDDQTMFEFMYFGYTPEELQATMMRFNKGLEPNMPRFHEELLDRFDPNEHYKPAEVTANPDREFWQEFEETFPPEYKFESEVLANEKQYLIREQPLWHEAFAKNSPDAELATTIGGWNFDASQFMNAISHDQVERMLEILDTRENFDLNKPIDMILPLQHAVMNKALNAVKFLVKAGADPACAGDLGFDPYSIADWTNNYPLKKIMEPYLPADYSQKKREKKEQEVRERLKSGETPQDIEEDLEDQAEMIEMLPKLQATLQGWGRFVETYISTPGAQLELFNAKQSINKLREDFEEKGWTNEDAEWFHDEIGQEIIEEKEKLALRRRGEKAGTIETDPEFNAQYKYYEDRFRETQQMRKTEFDTAKLFPSLQQFEGANMDEINPDDPLWTFTQVMFTVRDAGIQNMENFPKNEEQMRKYALRILRDNEFGEQELQHMIRNFELAKNPSRAADILPDSVLEPMTEKDIKEMGLEDELDAPLDPAELNLPIHTLTRMSTKLRTDQRKKKSKLPTDQMILQDVLKEDPKYQNRTPHQAIETLGRPMQNPESEINKNMSFADFLPKESLNVLKKLNISDDPEFEFVVRQLMNVKPFNLTPEQARNEEYVDSLIPAMDDRSWDETDLIKNVLEMKDIDIPLPTDDDDDEFFSMRNRKVPSKRRLRRENPYDLD